MDRDEIKTVLAAAKVMWPHATLWPDGHATLAVDVWTSMLGDLDRETVMAALEAIALDGGAHPPAVGALRQRACSLVAEATGTGVPSFGDAWAEVQTMVARRGYWNGPTDWSHPAIEEAVQSMTWRTLCHSTNTDVAMAAFRRVYEVIAQRYGRIQTATPRLQASLAAMAERFAIGAGDAEG